MTELKSLLRVDTSSLPPNRSIKFIELRSFINGKHDVLLINCCCCWCSAEGLGGAEAEVVEFVNALRVRIAPIIGSLESEESSDCCLPKLAYLERKRVSPGLAKKPPEPLLLSVVCWPLLAPFAVAIFVEVPKIWKSWGEKKEIERLIDYKQLMDNDGVKYFNIYQEQARWLASWNYLKEYFIEGEGYAFY